MNIELIDLPKPYQISYEGKSYDLYDIDFYPNRKFKKEIKILLYHEESLNNVEFFDNFMRCDQEDTKVIVYTSLNFFPIASMIGHKCILLLTNISHSYQSKVSKFKLNWEVFCNGKWNFDTRYIRSKGRGDLHDLRQIQDNDIDELFDFFKNRNCYINKDAYNTFCSIQHEFPKNAICVELKLGYKEMVEHFTKLKDPNIIGVMKDFQNNIIKKYNAHGNYLSYQILASILRGWKFIGIAGSSSLLLSAIPTNCIFLSDNLTNVSLEAIEFKNRFNMMFYGYKTYGFQHWQKDPSRKIELRWKEIVKTINQPKIKNGTLPKIIDIYNKKIRIKKIKIKPKYNIIINRVRKFR